MVLIDPVTIDQWNDQRCYALRGEGARTTLVRDWLLSAAACRKRDMRSKWQV